MNRRYIHRDVQRIANQTLTIIFDNICDTMISKIQTAVHIIIMTRFIYNYNFIYDDIKVKY